MKLVNYLLIFIFLIFTPSFSESPSDFLKWKNNFKKIALENDISEKTFDTVMANIKFLPNVIKYDRYQPEFYEDTKTYISKRTSSKKVTKEKQITVWTGSYGSDYICHGCDRIPVLLVRVKILLQG